MLRALIPAAGRGLRAWPKTTYTPKVMLEIDGRSLIERNIENLRDSLGVRDYLVVDGYMSDQVREHLGDGSRLDVSIAYLHCDDVDRGLAYGLSLAREQLKEPFLTVLGDELYLGSNHQRLGEILGRDFDAVCAVMHTTERHRIRQNYSVEIADGRITRLVEKPTDPPNDLLGCGTYVFTPRIFEAIDATPPSRRSGRVELTDAINWLAQHTPGVLPFELEGTYFNINSSDEHNYANYVARSQRDDYSVSVIIPAYNEEESVAEVVSDFRDRVDEVLVVDNSSQDRTAEVARAAGARVETVRCGGYGDTLRWGMDHARGDILVLTEADGSFRARDLDKLLTYLRDADMVMGTRTTRQLVEQATNMRGLVRWGNVIVAKLVEALWWSQEPRFTDVGCTYRALWRETHRQIRPLLRGVGPELSPEMMIAALLARKRIIEVPVSYHERLAGESKHSANYLHISKTALKMLRRILALRAGRY